MTVTIIRGDARALPLADHSVDLVVTSPPYWALRSYQDGGEHYVGQIGSEPTPGEYVDALIDCTGEWMRVLKPSGSIWVNLGDKYGPDKSRLLLPEQYRIACRDRLGLLVRAVVIWSKPNGLPESVADRVRNSHEDWVHMTLLPHYYSAVDEIREPASGYFRATTADRGVRNGSKARRMADTCNPLGKLPGSVWEIATQPLTVPADLGIDHFAAFPLEWPRRLIRGWSPREVCTECGEGRRPATETTRVDRRPSRHSAYGAGQHGTGAHSLDTTPFVSITHYTCACPDPSAHGLPSVVLDPFGGTGTTALAATTLGRTGITVDASADYCRLARWRCSDPGERAKALQVDKPPTEASGQAALFGEAS